MRDPGIVMSIPKPDLESNTPIPDVSEMVFGLK